MKTLTVSDVMTGNVTTLRPDAPFKSVVWTLATRRVSGAPVVNADGAVLGIVSEADLLPKESRESRESRVRPWPLSSRGRRSRARKAQALRAGELMSAPALTVAPNTPLPQAAAMFARHGVRRFPVVDTAGHLVGVVSRGDVLRAFLRADTEIAGEIERDVIKAAMCVDPATVQIRVRDGVVELSGQLERKSMIAITEALTRTVDGVVAVTNDLTYAMDDTRIRPTEPEYVGIQHVLRRR